MQLWAHRGAGKGPHENTLAWFDKARLAGFDRVEFDVMLTQDGVPVVHHDWVTGRCAKPLPSLGWGAEPKSLLNITWAELQQHRVGDQAVPSLQQAVNWCVQHGMTANVEIKARNPLDARRVGHAVHLCMQQAPQAQHAWWAEQVVFSSFYHASLLPLKGHHLALLYEEVPRNWVLHADFLQAQAIHLHHSLCSPTLLRCIHTSGRRVRVYTVNDPELALSLQALGVEALFTDNMDLPATLAAP